jgi:hypothetical protein
MIFQLRDLIPSAQIGTPGPFGKYVRAMHEPFHGGLLDRMRDAWAVLKGPSHAVAVRWPKHGEFEQAIANSRR